MRLLITCWLYISLALALSGCTHMPADIAAELSAPDGQRPNHYAATPAPAASE